MLDLATAPARAAEPGHLGDLNHLAGYMRIVTPLVPGVVAAVTEDNHVAGRTMAALTLHAPSKFGSAAVVAARLAATGRVDLDGVEGGWLGYVAAGLCNDGLGRVGGRHVGAALSCQGN